MEWILGFSADIVVDANQLKARHEYIQKVTNSEVSPWSFIQLEGKIYKQFVCCESKDGLNGVFITAHIGAVKGLCAIKEIATKDFVVANTCIWERFSEKDTLAGMMKHNKKAELWFAKQALSVENKHILRQSTTVEDIGKFGFQTSVSERKMFANRRKGFMEAVNLSFDKVSLIILPIDLGGIV